MSTRLVYISNSCGTRSNAFSRIIASNDCIRFLPDHKFFGNSRQRNPLLSMNGAIWCVSSHTPLKSLYGNIVADRIYAYVYADYLFLAQPSHCQSCHTHMTKIVRKQNRQINFAAYVHPAGIIEIFVLHSQMMSHVQ